jgi:uncharacterized RDD family membrane protein YckC
MPDHDAALAQSFAARPAAGLLRRLAAGTYDLVLVIALWVLATLLIIVARGGQPVPVGNPLYQALLLALAASFFAGFWYWGGQTLGMRAWRMQVRRQDGAPLSAREAALRLAALLLALAPAGIGLMWMLVDRDRLPWHDRLAGTRVIVLPKGA